MLTDAAAGGDVLALQEALQVAHLQVGNGVSVQRPRGKRSARRAHGAATAPQAAAAVVPLALATSAFPLEYAELHGAALAGHLTAVTVTVSSCRNHLPCSDASARPPTTTNTLLIYTLHYHDKSNIFII